MTFNAYGYLFCGLFYSPQIQASDAVKPKQDCCSSPLSASVSCFGLSVVNNGSLTAGNYCSIGFKVLTLTNYYQNGLITWKTVLFLQLLIHPWFHSSTSWIFQSNCGGWTTGSEVLHVPVDSGTWRTAGGHVGQVGSARDCFGGTRGSWTIYWQFLCNGSSLYQS